MEKDRNIELRSEALRAVIGRVPPLVVRVGTAVTALVTLVLAAAVCMVPYPMTIKTEGCVAAAMGNGTVVVKSSIPYKYIYLFDTPRAASATFEGHPNAVAQGRVESVDTAVVRAGGDNYFVATLLFAATGQAPAARGEKAAVEVVVSDRTVLQLLIGKPDS